MSENTEELLFDEFGNPINASSDDSSDSDSDLSVKDADDDHFEQGNEETNEDRGAIVLAEDKTYYPTLSSTFDKDVETVIATFDAKTLNDPIVEPQVEKRFIIEESELPTTSYSKEYMWQMSTITERVRNVALCGNLHSGKTSILDMLIDQTHSFNNYNSENDEKQLRYTDNHILEVKRGISIKSSVMSLLLPGLDGNSTLVNVIDSPGHCNFADEMAISVRLADIVILCVDVVESMTQGLELVIEYALKTNTRLMLIVTKLDRLILELRLSPLDAYHKIRRVIEQVNTKIEKYCTILDIEDNNDITRLSPELGNVCFSSSRFNMIFNLTSFTKKYFEFNNIKQSLKVSIESFSRKLWGDIYYEDKKFFTKPSNPLASANNRTFIKFILDPIYKLTMASLSLDALELQQFVEKKMKLRLKKHKYKLNSKPFLKELFTAFFGFPSLALMNSLKSLPSPVQNSQAKLNYLYTGLTTSSIAEHITKCDPEGPLIAYVSKLVDTTDSENFYALVRILSGTIKENQTVKLLGEEYSNGNIYDCKSQKINRCYMWCGRYKVNVPELKAGSVGLISGPDIDNFIVKTASIFDESLDDTLYTFKGADKLFSPVFKVAVQAYNPKDLNQFLDSLKKLNRSYVGCEIRVEDSGEHSILGFGELYMDCLLHDFRILYSGIEIKVSDPMVKFNETLDGHSKIKLITKSNNGKNSISIIAEPLDAEIIRDIKNGTLNINRDPPRKLAKKLRDRYHWDSLAARSVWGVGPDDLGSSILCDDTLPDEIDKNLLLSLKDKILKGFQWATREGPLCDEPISHVKFRIIGANFAEDEIDRNDAQIIQMIRKACHSALLISEPKLLEPIYNIEVLCHSDVVDALEKLIERRRGYILDKERIDGTPLWKVNGSIPVIESVGLETDLRLATRGMAYPQLIFNKWERVPGDPLDETAFIPLLKRVPLLSSSRDFMMKTRRRKGLSDDVSLKHYVAAETWEMLQELGIF